MENLEILDVRKMAMITCRWQVDQFHSWIDLRDLTLAGVQS